ncbi:MAG TPA: hypothetical protein VFP86_21020, partial [bacterium]|nr:hypothetical protein [bacterium]
MAHHKRNCEEHRSQQSKHQRDDGGDVPFVEEAVPCPGLVFPPREQQSSEYATPPPPEELFLTVEADLRPREFPQDLRIDRGRFNSKSGKDIGDEIGSEVDIVSEGGTNPLYCLF